MTKVKAVLHTTHEGIAKFTENAYLLYKKLEKDKAMESVLAEKKGASQ